MEETDRLPMAPGDEITLSSAPERIDALHFAILGNAASGRSAFCYEAMLGHRRGWLKEFYPEDFARPGKDQYLALQRGEDNQLCAPGDAMAARFREMCRSYAKGYDMLHRKADVGLIAGHRLYFGGSVYVWTPGAPRGRSLRCLIAEIHQNPQIYDLARLRQLLCILKELTGAIRCLHAGGLLHLDICPDSVYLVPAAEGETLRLYDTDGIHSLRSGFVNVAGSEDSRAPEVLRGRAGNRSDIYSIGRLLLYAIAPQQAYRDEDYPHLGRYVAFSPLICALKPRSHAYLRYILEQILRRCLNPKPDSRYRCCEELLSDLELAIGCCIP